MITIPLNNNVMVYLSKSENNDEQITFRIKDAHNRYFEGAYKIEDFQDLFNDNLTIDQFFEYLEKNNPSVLESKNNNEIILKIKASRSMDIVLKETNINNKTIKIKDFINNETPKGDNIIKNEFELFKPLKIEITNKENLNLSKSNMKNNCIILLNILISHKMIFCYNYSK